MHMLAPSSDLITLAEINAGGTPVCIPTGSIVYDAEHDTSGRGHSLDRRRHAHLVLLSSCFATASAGRGVRFGHILKFSLNLARKVPDGNLLQVDGA
jgi:hypothetical protein